MKKFFPVLFTTLIFAQSYPGDDAIRKGVHAFYNYETAKAIEILAKVRQDHPENPTIITKSSPSRRGRPPATFMGWGG